MSKDKIEYTRETSETSVRVELEVQGQGQTLVRTGTGYGDHMITLLAFWAGFDLTVEASGDIQVDSHHSLEDIGLCLGEALNRSLGDRSGLARVGWALVPMDEALVEAVIDLSGRPYLVYEDHILPEIVFGQEKDLWREFFKSLAFKAGMNLHILYRYGRNGHHLVEAACKAVGLGLGRALMSQDRGLMSTKGRLD